MKRLYESVDERYLKKAIVEYIDILNEYNMKDLYRKDLLPKVLENEFGISFHFGSGYLTANGLDARVDADSTIEDAIKQVDAFLGSNNKDEVALKNRYTQTAVYIKEVGRGVYVCNDQYSMTQMDTFFELLLWAVTDEITKDRRGALNITDRLQLTGAMDKVQSFNEYIPEVECTVIKQKNGIVKLKGADQEVIDRMDYIVRLTNKYNRS
jgi:hypothetical protein